MSAGLTFVLVVVSLVPVPVTVMIQHFIPYKPTETTCGQQVYLVSALADLHLFAHVFNLHADQSTQVSSPCIPRALVMNATGEHCFSLRLHG